jgi:transposase InsO family protein
MSSTPDREAATARTSEAVIADAQCAEACAVLQINEDRSGEGWTRVKPTPINALSLPISASRLSVPLYWKSAIPRRLAAFRQARLFLNWLTSRDILCLCPAPTASSPRMDTTRPHARRKPAASYKASARFHVWTRDISRIPRQVAGMPFSLYLIVDIFSRTPIGWEVHDREARELAAEVIERTV